MDFRSLPTLTARRFAFDGDACLYRDHRGQRVVADAEGPGRFAVERGSVEIQTDFEGDSFQHGFTAVALADAAVRLYSGGGRDFPDPDARTEQIDGVHHGSGWVVETDAPFSVDRRCEAAPAPLPHLPTPFWSEYRGGRATIVERPWAAVRLDAFSIADQAALEDRAFRVQNLSDVRGLDSSFDDGTAHRAPVASHLNTASWDAVVPAGALALVLRKTHDRFHGRQRARVSVDGVEVGYWYEPEECRARRWGVSDFLAAVPHTGGAVRLAVDPVAGTPLWSVSDIEVWALVHQP